ncbi:MAG: hypothetical protein QW067_04270 [Thermofilaceae archaeon]
MEKLKFFDIKEKKAFETDQYRVEIKETKAGRKVKIAYAVSPYTGKEVARILGTVKE